MTHRARLFISALCLTCFVPVDNVFAEGNSCVVRNLQSVEEITKAQHCVMKELEEATIASDDIKAALDNILNTFKLAQMYAKESDKFLFVYRKTQDKRAEAKHKDYKTLYRKAFSTFETYRRHLDDIRRTRREFTQIIEGLKERIKILHEYESLLRNSNERHH